MRAWLEDDYGVVRQNAVAVANGRYMATLQALDEAVSTLNAGLQDARTAPRVSRNRILNDLHKRVRGMGLLLNDTLADYAPSTTPDERHTPR